MYLPAGQPLGLHDVELGVRVAARRNCFRMLIDDLAVLVRPPRRELHRSVAGRVHGGEHGVLRRELARRVGHALARVDVAAEPTSATATVWLPCRQRRRRLFAYRHALSFLLQAPMATSIARAAATPSLDSMVLSCGSSRVWEGEYVARIDQIRILDAILVCLIDRMPFVRVAELALRDLRQAVAGLDRDRSLRFHRLRSSARSTNFRLRRRRSRPCQCCRSPPWVSPCAGSPRSW